MIFAVIAVLILPLHAQTSWKAKEEMTKALTEGKIPAMACVTFDREKILNQAAVGTTRSDKKIDLPADAQWHIGSNGKAMTATLVARLVEKKIVNWDTPMSEIFPEASKEFHPEARKITLLQLLSHTAGLPPNPAGPDRLKSRLEVTKIGFKEKPGTGFKYSNWGYIVAAAAVEKLTNSKWEKAIETEVFTPLGIKPFDFGAPVGENVIHGHYKGRPAPTGVAGDNPPLYGPAGGIHLSLADWVVFARDQMNGLNGKGKILTKESYPKLHTPVGGSYALGWGTWNEDGTIIGLGHDGSNTLWYARISLDLNDQIGILTVANEATPTIKNWISQVEKAAK